MALTNHTAHHRRLCLLLSSLPGPLSSLPLRTDLARRVLCVAGYSAHTPCTTVAVHTILVASDCRHLRLSPGATGTCSNCDEWEERGNCPSCLPLV